MAGSYPKLFKVADPREIPYAKNIGGGFWESECRKCKAKLLIEADDQVMLAVAKRSGLVLGALCDPCAKGKIQGES